MKSGVHKVGEKTNKILNISKLKIEMAEYKNSISDRQRLVGKYVYDTYNSERDFNFDDVAAWLEEIKNLELKIISCEEKLQNVQNRLKCPNCGSNNSSDAKYCKFCGRKLSDEEIKDESHFSDVDENEDKKEEDL